MGLILTLALGLFIILGAGIVFLTKNNQKFIQFSISLAFSVMVMLILVDLLPEAWECLGQEQTMWSTILILGICIVVGFVILLGLDQFIPDHEEKKGKQEEQNHMKHIGLVSSIALVIHNLMEGMAISLLVTNDLRAGLLAGIGVALHNIPLGMVIASTFYESNHSIKKTMWIILGISLSTFVGGMFPFLFETKIPEIIEGIFFGITIGMLLYIVIMELLPQVLHTKEKKVTWTGIALGVVLLLLTLFL